jgi:hypothetical protein
VLRTGAPGDTWASDRREQEERAIDQIGRRETVSG